MMVGDPEWEGRLSQKKSVCVGGGMNERAGWFSVTIHGANRQHLTFTPWRATCWRCGAKPSRAKVSRKPLEGAGGGVRGISPRLSGSLDPL